jgi:hypothetical protein
MEIPMFDDGEWHNIAQSTSVREANSIPKRDDAMLAEYNRITGFGETNPNTVYHHRLSLYGPACKHCAKPLRTPKAKICGACLTPVAQSQSDPQFIALYWSAATRAFVA